ncbi:MAG: Rid family detoxifying hydrolase [Gemmatimonadales bacterium]|nr:Rid family detoxifying hydrolase [Gemmatimonadales bacterium]
MHPVTTDQAPRPAGHYAQGMVHAGIVYVSGQLPIDPATGEVVAGDIAVQADRTLRNVAAVLEAAGSGLDRVLMLSVFVVSRDDWPAVNVVCERLFGTHRPARAVVGGADLKAGCRVEMVATAMVKGS